MHLPRFALCLVLTTIVLRADLEFVGYVKSGDTLNFVLTDVKTGRISDFLGIGASFSGAKITDFDAKEETLTVKAGDAVQRLPLRAAQVRAGKSGAKEPTVLHVSVSSDGKMMFDGRPLAADALNTMLATMAKMEATVELEVHEPPNPNKTSHEATKRIGEALRASGIRKWSIKVVDG